MITSEATRNVINFLLFQAGWLICVIFPGKPAAAVAVGFIVLHFLLVSQHRMSELQFIGLGTVLGAAMDLLWFRTGILGLDSQEVLLTPPWLVAIWALFMTTLCHSLNWISRKTWLPFVLAPIAGPFAYWSASKLGAITLPDLPPSLLAMAIGWLVIFPLLLLIRRTLYPELQA